jgi:hypothetical protein
MNTTIELTKLIGMCIAKILIWVLSWAIAFAVAVGVGYTTYKLVTLIA